MLNFTGLCSYPLGGYVTAALMASTMAAVTTTIYATISCRFVVVTFSSDTDTNTYGGGFEEYFQNMGRRSSDGTDGSSNNSTTTTADDVATVVHRTSLGLYQWLRPITNDDDGESTTTITDWTVGTCVGYQQTMLAAIQSANAMFDLSRIVAIFAILLGLFQFSWMFTSSCISMNRIQLYLFLFLSVCGTAFTGLTFLFYKSSVCTTEFNNSAYCQIDQGGLVMIAAILLWSMTLLISIYYVIPVVMVVSSSDSVDFELHPTRTPEEKQKLALQREIYKELRRQQKEQRDQRKAAAKHSSDENNMNKDVLPLFISPTKPNDDDKQIPSSSRRRQQPLPLSSNDDSSKQEYPTIRNSYSYDSKESWLRPIPKRSNNNNNTDTNQARHGRSVSLENVRTDTTIAANVSNLTPQQQQQRQLHLPPVGPIRFSTKTHPQQQHQSNNTNSNSLSRFIRMPSLPRIPSSVDNNHAKTPPSSLSNLVIRQTDDTEDFEIQPETTLATRQPTISTNTTPIKAIVPPVVEKAIALPAEKLPTTTTATATALQPPSLSEGLSLRPAQQQLANESPSAVQQTTTTAKTQHQQERNPLNTYIAKRLDNIERLTR